MDNPAIGGLWNRTRLLQAAGFDLVDDTKRALGATRDALTANRQEGQPDHAIRLKAAEQVYDLADVRRHRDDPANDPTRVIAVSIVLAASGNSHGHHPDAELSVGGVRLHLEGGGGDER